MGCCYSRVEREEMVSRCKSRKRYMKQLVKACFRMLKLPFIITTTTSTTTTTTTTTITATITTTSRSRHRCKPRQPHNHLCHHLHSAQAPIRGRLPPPSTTRAPPLPLPPSSTWDFRDPFAASSSRPVMEEEWETMTTASKAVITVTAASTVELSSVVSGFSKESGTTTSELAMVVSRNAKDLVEIIKELDEYFLKAADAGRMLSLLLEVP
ncbi:hypothetical protein TB1_046105 [Malus domestica]